MTSPWRSRSSRLLLSSLLVSYLFGAILYTAEGTAAPSEPEIPSSSLVTNEQSSSLIICAVDGSVYTIDALTGMAKGYFSTGRPLVGSSSAAIVPGLDGSIYTLSKSRQVSKLPVTVQHCVQHPVQTCTGDECGVVTGTKHTFLYGLDPTTGRLEWTQQYGKTDPDDTRNSTPVVILHREDFVVRHISTLTGEELWNVTLGHVSALDFSTMQPDRSSSVDEPLLPGPSVIDELANGAIDPETKAVSLPSIAFGSDGTTVTAIDDQQQVLWKRQLSTVIASVYGAVGNDWVPLSVVDSAKERVDQGTTAMVPLSPPPTHDLKSQQREIYLRLLWDEAQRVGTENARASDMVIFKPPHVDLGRAEMNRLAQKATTRSPTPLPCQGQTIDGVCVNTPLLESGNQKEQPAGIYLTWDRLFVGAIILGLAIRVFMAHKRRVWIADRQTASPLRRDLPGAFLPEGPIIQRDRELSPSETLTAPERLTDLRFARHPNVPDPALYTVGGQSGADIWNIEKEGLGPVTSAPIATDTSASSSTGHIDGIPFVKHSRYHSEFREIGPLGKGGFGTVFRCENVLDGRQYAIKKVRIPAGEEFSQRLQRVLREVKTLARLDHPNIVRYYTAWLEAEEHDHGQRESADSMEGSNSVGMCYSVELVTSNPPSTSEHGRNNHQVVGSGKHGNKKDSRLVYDMANPLGWNGIDVDLDESFGDKELHVSQGSDCGGFHFDRSAGSFDLSGNIGSSSRNESKDVRLAHSPSNSAATPMANNKRHLSVDLSSDSEAPTSEKAASIEMQSLPTTNVRHTLYIQMHLCSQKTLSDFLSKSNARKGGTGESPVDIPLALKIFHQVAEGVQHVHEQGLIHRDLKPSNCFIDDGVVKVGDFGLSRESSASSAPEEAKETWLDLGGDGEDFSAGIGTRAYASPEQQQGSNYDASTDVYSLGIILFELCYPMCTGMERNVVLSRLRQREFPQDWQDTVASSFPIVHSLVTSMLSPQCNDRPSAATVASKVESLLGEFTVLYLDRNGHEDDCTLLRVEAVAHQGILPQTIELINDVAPHAKIVQYGLRGQDSNAIMEFAISSANKECVERIMSKLQSATEVHVVRQIADSASINL